MFPEVLCCCLFNLKSSPLLKFLLVWFGRERSLSIGPARDLEVSQTSSIDMLTPLCLFPLYWRGKILGLCPLSQSHKVRPDADSLLFISPRVVPWSVQCVPSPISQRQASHWNSYAFCRGSHTPSVEACTCCLWRVAHAFCGKAHMPFVDAHMHHLDGVPEPVSRFCGLFLRSAWWFLFPYLALSIFPIPRFPQTIQSWCSPQSPG